MLVVGAIRVSIVGDHIKCFPFQLNRCLHRSANRTEFSKHPFQSLFHWPGVLIKENKTVKPLALSSVTGVLFSSLIEFHCIFSESEFVFLATRTARAAINQFYWSSCFFFTFIPSCGLITIRWLENLRMCLQDFEPTTHRIQVSCLSFMK